MPAVHPLSDRVAFAVPPTSRNPRHLHLVRDCRTFNLFWDADSVTVFSHDVALADAWATAICNEIRPDDTSVLLRINAEEVTGVFSVIGEWTSSYGHLPPLVRANVRKDLITAGRNQ